MDAEVAANVEIAVLAEAPPPRDLSPRVVSLARVLDRLPPGEYVVRIVKPEIKQLAWRAEIVQETTVRVMECGGRE